MQGATKVKWQKVRSDLGKRGKAKCCEVEAANESGWVASQPDMFDGTGVAAK